MRKFQIQSTLGSVLSFVIFASMARAADKPVFRSHPPTRPLAAPSDRALSTGPSLFVDVVRGDDCNDGAESRPWKTLSHAAQQLKPGDTLSLRGGTYFEHAAIACRGTRDKPICIRSYPGELAVINGGIREFMEAPQTAWEPCPAGVAGEFQSQKIYAGLADSEGCNLLGNFADSMLPLQGYRFLVDLRDPSMVWDVDGKVDGKEGVYCGPGIFYAVETGRIHVRLAHTNIKALHNDNYRGETDPRKLSLIIAGLKSGPALTLSECRFVTLQDIVVCGARTATVEIRDCRDVTCDGVTVYGGSSAINVEGTSRLRIYNTACRGIAAPWTFRGHLKYRAIEARIFSTGGWSPTGRENQDFELAFSEFTDCVDGVFIGNVKNVHFHHNLLDNVSDDGMFLTSATACDGTTPGGDHYIYQNLLSRCLTTFAFGVGHGRQKMTTHGRQTGSGVWVFRNVFDLRRPVYYQLPEENDDQVNTHGRMANDHGSPAWEPMTIYHNTIVEEVPMRREYYLSDLGAHTSGCGARRLFNNIAVQAEGAVLGRFPPIVLPADKTVGQGTPTDLQADGNMHWSYRQQPDAKSFFDAFRKSGEFATSQKLYAPGWTTHDIVADPLFSKFSGDWKRPILLELSTKSPAIDAGVAIPREWPDPLRAADDDKSDIGAIPAGCEPWRVGVRGRLTVFGEPAPTKAAPTFSPVEFSKRPHSAAPEGKPAGLVKGYPARDAEFIHFVLAKQGVPTIEHDETWLNTNDYAKYGFVALVGDLARAQMKPNRYTEADLQNVQRYLEQGGTLLLMRLGTQAFDSPHGRLALSQLTGDSAPQKDAGLKLRMPEHPWLKHLDLKLDRSWIASRSAMPLLRNKGEALIGTDDGGAATLLRVPAGKGQLIYIGWEISDFLPHGRQASTPDDERNFEEQIQLLRNIVKDVYPAEALTK